MLAEIAGWVRIWDFPPCFLEDSRLYLRPPQVADGKDWVQLRSEYKAALAPWEPLWPASALSSSFFKRRRRQQIQSWRAGQSCSFLLFHKDDHQLMGGVNINNIIRGPGQYASLGYWLAPPFQGFGYMNDALSLIISYGFECLALHRFHAGCLPENHRSRAVLARLGFREEGYAVRYLQIAGQWQDHVLYGLTAEEWDGSGTRHD